MSIKIAINGFGRIGRAALKRILDKHPDLEVVAINDLTDPGNLAHLLHYDSVYGPYEKAGGWIAGHIFTDEKKIKVLAESEPAKLPWKKEEVDIVLECTGRFTKQEEAAKHLTAGAKKVIISANAKTGETPHFVLGVNEKAYNPQKHHIVANCSCTTNCAAPVMKLLNENFKVLKAQMTTVHAVTASQNLVDGPKKDWREGRSAMNNTIPAATGAAEAVIRVLPELKGRISGSAFRVPVLCGSVLEIIAQIEKETTVEKINSAFERAAKGGLKKILAVSRAQLVSSDIIGTDYSAIVDADLTEVLDLPGVEDENLVKVVAWYDNEYAYACRLVELAEYIGKKL